MKASNLFWAAAIGGGLYWASKQPGGINGTYNKLSDKVKEIQNSSDPLGTLKQQVSAARFGNSSSNDLYQPTAGMNGPAPVDVSANQPYSSTF